MLVLALKGAAWWLTGSVALYSDALESVVNVVASLVAFVALSFAVRPADKNHPYGHDKAEFFAAVIEGVLIIVAALSILQHAWSHWGAPASLDTPWVGLGLNLVATASNAFWALLLQRTGAKYRSAALSADARHLWADVVTSTGVVAGLVLAIQTGIGWLDPLLAVIVALHVLWSGMGVMRDSVGGLMDAAPAETVVVRIREIVGLHADGAIEAHDLRTRHAGRLTYLEFHLVVPGQMRVDEAHAICDRVEAALKAEVDGLVITIHVEPEGKAKHSGVLVL
ncbi:MAG: cation diffusion facilitator family transporter [Acetobacteraceae bacterium]